MDRVVKIIWALSVTSMVFVACNKGGGGAQVNGPRGRNGQNQNKPTDSGNGAAAGRQVLDPAKMTDEQKAMAVDIKSLRVLFRDAADLYGEGWKAIVTSNQTQNPKKENVGNMLKLISQIIEDNFDASGAPYLSKDVTNKKGQVMAQVSCSSPGSSQVKVVSGVKSTYDIYFGLCKFSESSNIKGSTGDMKKIATISRNSKGDRNFSVSWEIADLDGSPDQMMGLFVNSPNKKKEDGQEKLGSGCDLEAFLQGHLATMMCHNMAQDISKNEYAVVTSFDFKHPKYEKRDHPVMMEFKEYTIKDDNTEDERPGRVIDDPVTDKMWVKMDGAPKEYVTDIAKANAAIEAAKKAEQQRQEAQEAQKAREAQPSGVQQQQQNSDESAAPSGAQPSQDVGPSTSRDASASAT